MRHKLRVELQDDWTKAFVDGKLVAEAHNIDVDSLDFQAIMKALEIELEQVEVEEDE